MTLPSPSKILATTWNGNPSGLLWTGEWGQDDEGYFCRTIASGVFTPPRRFTDDVAFAPARQLERVLHVCAVHTDLDDIGGRPCGREDDGCRAYCGYVPEGDETADEIAGRGVCVVCVAMWENETGEKAPV